MPVGITGIIILKTRHAARLRGLFAVPLADAPIRNVTARTDRVFGKCVNTDLRYSFASISPASTGNRSRGRLLLNSNEKIYVQNKSAKDLCFCHIISPMHKALPFRGAGPGAVARPRRRRPTPACAAASPRPAGRSAVSTGLKSHTSTPRRRGSRKPIRCSAPPAAAAPNTTTTLGHQVFQSIGCDACHTIRFTTGLPSTAALSKVSFRK